MSDQPPSGASSGPVSRREFVRHAVVAGGALALPWSENGPGQPNGPHSRQPADNGAQQRDELFELTVNNAGEMMRSGALTSHALTECYLARIEAMDKKGPAVNAV